MKNLLKKLGTTLKDPALHPVEVWALKALLGVIAVKLGIDLKTLVD